MILTAHQPVYLPWVGLFHKISLADTFVIFDTVQYLPKEWMNRNKIKIKNDYCYLSVPVLDKGYLNKKIYEIRINNNSNWRSKHFKSIYINYKKSKFFKNYINFFEETYLKEWVFLSELNIHMLKFFLKELNIEVKILKASDLNIKGRKSELVLDMCKKLNVKKYIFGEQGRNYADKQSFKDNQIDIVFQKYNHPTYDQIQGNFISHLSIVDLLFNCGSESLKVLINKN
jgi:hypothetical protein